MNILGIAATPDADLDGHILLAGAVDCTKRVPLCRDHKQVIGEVISLHYIGDKLYVTAETDDPSAARLDYFSAAGRPLQREKHGQLWHVSKVSLTEISLTNSPLNKHCRVTGRQETNPARELEKSRCLQFDLLVQRMSRLVQLTKLIHREATP